MGGFAYPFSDSDKGALGTSKACVNSTEFCGKGTVGVASTATWGAGMGVDLNDMPGGGGAMAYTVPATTKGVSYAITALPTGTFYMIIGNDTTTPATAYYATLTAASGMVPWSKFATTPWQADASVALSAPPVGPTHVQFQISAGTVASSFNFCVTTLAFY